MFIQRVAQLFDSPTVRRCGIVVTTCAVATLFAATVFLDDSAPVHAIDVAGSGHGAGGGGFTQPNAPVMSLGASTSPSAPESVPATTMAKPAIKAGAKS